ncbi:MAG: hypothetical protein IJV72_07350 [Clostridia bacterium]|nr:hypothetical protein [Clostridia bacterium]
MDKKEQSGYFTAEGVFAASNSANGFKSYYGEIFDGKRFERIYIIKGGPGTGKSKFMKDTAKYAEDRGYRVEYYYCSSDPDSLDGIIIDGRVAMIDGTAPHPRDTEIAGARDEIINLGEFWDGQRLAGRYAEILELSEKKSAAYAKGYRYLRGCGELSDINASLFYPAIREEKLLSSVERIVSGIPSGEGGEALPALVDSVGMRGRVRFDTYERSATRLYSVIDWYSTAHLFLRAVAVAAQRKNMAMRISYEPINAERPDAVFFCESGVAFVAVPPSESEDALGTRINMRRFIDKDTADRVKREYKYNMRLYEALLSSACEAFEEAGEYHFELERIYSSCMDFPSKERYTASFCEMLLGVLGK